MFKEVFSMPDLEVVWEKYGIDMEEGKGSNERSMGIYWESVGDDMGI